MNIMSWGEIVNMGALLNSSRKRAFGLKVVAHFALEIIVMYSNINLFNSNRFAETVSLILGHVNELASNRTS